MNLFIERAGRDGPGKISATFAEAGHLNEHGRPFNPHSNKAILER
jgi:hypothetical protein